MTEHAMAPCSKDDPLLIAWNAYKKTEEYRSTKGWALDPVWCRDQVNVDGNLWGAFMAGWLAATERAAMLHESVCPTSDEERLNKVPGAGAMGAVVEYRDLIRERGLHPV